MDLELLFHLLTFNCNLMLVSIFQPHGCSLTLSAAGNSFSSKILLALQHVNKVSKCLPKLMPCLRSSFENEMNAVSTKYTAPWPVFTKNTPDILNLLLYSHNHFNVTVFLHIHSVIILHIKHLLWYQRTYKH